MIIYYKWHSLFSRSTGIECRRYPKQRCQGQGAGFYLSIPIADWARTRLAAGPSMLKQHQLQGGPEPHHSHRCTSYRPPLQREPTDLTGKEAPPILGRGRGVKLELGKVFSERGGGLHLKSAALIKLLRG